MTDFEENGQTLENCTVTENAQTPENCTVTENAQMPEKGGEIRFFGGDISFDAPETYDDTPDKKKKIRFAFSMTHFSVFIYLMISQGAAALLMLFVSLSLAVSGVGTDAVNSDLLLVINAVSQYIIAFPIFLLLARTVKGEPKKVKERLSVGRFLLLFVVAEGVMLGVASISSLCSSLFDRMLGISGENPIDALLGESNLIITFVCTCILAPIFEELIFRKIMMDRLSAFGGGVAICFSAVAFGLFHGNFSQIFYATAVGIVLGYVYHRTGKVIYTVILHGMLNFVGGILPLEVDWMSTESERIRALAEAGAEVNVGLITLYDILTAIYGLAMLMFIGAAVTIIVLAIIKRKIKLEKSEEYDTKTVVKTGIANTGFVLMTAASLVLAIITMLSF